MQTIITDISEYNNLRDRFGIVKAVTLEWSPKTESSQHSLNIIIRYEDEADGLYRLKAKFYGLQLLEMDMPVFCGHDMSFMFACSIQDMEDVIKVTSKATNGVRYYAQDISGHSPNLRFYFSEFYAVLEDYRMT